MEPHVYISYINHEADFVAGLVRELAAVGFDKWYNSIDLRNLNGGHQHVKQAVRHSTVVLVIVTPDSIDDNAINYEWAIAREYNIPVVAVILQSPGTMPWPADYQIDLTNHKTPDLRHLVAIIQTTSEARDTAPAITPPAVSHSQGNGHKPNGTESPVEVTDPPISFDLTPPPPTANQNWQLQTALYQLRTGDVRDRREAIDMLCELRNPLANEAIINALHDQSVSVGKAAASALGTIKTHQAIPALCHIASNSQTHGDLREAAAKALGQIGNAQAVSVLCDAANQDSNMFVRLTAIDALGQIDDPRAVAGLVNVMKTSDYSRLRHAAVKALGNLNDVEVCWDLIAMLSDDEENIRHTAALVITQLVGIEGLNAALEYHDWRVREAAIWALGKQQYTEGIPMLLMALDDEDHAVRHTAAWSLGQMADPQTLDPLLHRASLETNSRVLAQIADALSNFDDLRSIRVLAEMMGHKHVVTREAAANTLGKIGHPQAISYLRPAVLEDPEAQVRLAAVKAISHIDAPAVIPALVLALDDEIQEVQQAASYALNATIGSLQAKDALRRWRQQHK